MQENDDNQSLISHLEALRSTLIKCFSAIGILLPFTFYFSPKFLDLLVKILISDTKITFNYFAPMEVFILQIKLALLMSVIIAFPYIAKQIWNFILPALYENERKFMGNMIFISGFLFITGSIFCLFVILPMVMRFGISFMSNGIQAMFGISNVVNLVLGLTFAFGIMFQVPLAVNMLVKWDILSYDTVSSKRPYVVVILLISAALLTPPDIISQLLLFLPTYLLFELGLLFSKKNKNCNQDKTKQL